ncbi:MAG: hypothetical protein LBD30_04475, partial [Verrucomicrobiales bacterium]|nr:hypothetical protein [Verrucomicrobiales bacterium]
MEPLPKIPSNLHPYAKEVLAKLSHNPAAREIILGGGVALSHYHEYRGMFDVNGWWRAEKSGEAARAIKGVMKEIAERDRLAFREREWHDVISFELLHGMKKQLSVQIGKRTVALPEIFWI